ncbi:MAG TPA: sugar ABC transporter permease [Anaerolineaceae bacterium]
MAQMELTQGSQQAGWWRSFSKSSSPYLYLFPAFLVMTVITFYPMFYQIYMAFHEFSLKNLRAGGPPPVAVGFANFINILTGNIGLSNFNFFYTLGFNLWWTFSNVFLHVAFGILIAVMLNTSGLWFKGLWRAIYVLPIVIPQIIIANVFRNMYDPDYGAINQGLAIFGKLLGLSPNLFHIRWIDQLAYPIPGIPLTLSFFALLICNVWLGWPFMAIVATGALQSIPKDLYEAAEIDGASGNQKFWTITLPLLRPAMVPATVYGITATFNLYTLIYFLSGGGPLRKTEILLTEAYRLVNEQNAYGDAAAFAIMIFIILLGLTVLTNSFTRATERYDV